MLIIKLSNIYLEKTPTWVIEEKTIFFRLKSAPPSSSFVVFLAGEQFAGKDEKSWKKYIFDSL